MGDSIIMSKNSSVQGVRSLLNRSDPKLAEVSLKVVSVP